jgi:hypothetical protein
MNKKLSEKLFMAYHQKKEKKYLTKKEKKKESRKLSIMAYQATTEKRKREIDSFVSLVDLNMATCGGTHTISLKQRNQGKRKATTIITHKAVHGLPPWPTTERRKKI